MSLCFFLPPFNFTPRTPLALVKSFLVLEKEGDVNYLYPESRTAARRRMSALFTGYFNLMLTNHNRPENLQGGNSGDSDNRNHKIIRLSEDSCLNQQIIEELESLFQFSSPKELSRYLRDVFLFSLTDHNHILLQDLQRKAESFYFLFKFLDLAEDEMGQEEGKGGWATELEK